MNKFMKLAFAAVIAAGLGSIAHAGQISIVADVVAAFENDGAFTPVALPDISMNQPNTLVYQVDFSVLASTDAGERNFGNIAFNLQFSGLSGDGSIGWVPSSETVDTNPNVPGMQAGPIFGINGDQGLAGDFLDIVVSLSNGLTAAHQQSQAVNAVNPTLMGSIYVTWDGSTPGTLAWTDLSGSFVLDNGLFGPDLTFAGGSIAFGGGTGGDGPDLGAGGALDFGYNGQSQFITLTNTGDETANFLGDQFEITGANAGLFSLVNPNFDPIAAGEDRMFEVLFNSGSNAQASYSADLTFLTDAGVNPVFALTAQVPEPSTIALAGLGMVGLVGLARRRRK